MISLSLQGIPVPKSRARVVRKGNRTFAYDPKATEQEQCRWQLKSQYKEAPLTTAIGMDVSFFMPIPKGTSSIRRRQMLNGRIYHIKKPDTDNLVKFVLDCLNGLVIEDDAQVVETRSRKLYGTSPSTEIRLITLNDIA